MIIDAISDLHGYYPKLPGGDLLIIAGDLTARDVGPDYLKFFTWIAKANYRKKIVVAGNHDMMIQESRKFIDAIIDFEYLQDSGTEFEGVKIWGSPWTKTFKGINPLCTAFTLVSDSELDEKWQRIPEDTDILITHCPPYGICDLIRNRHGIGDICEHVGSDGLYCQIHRIQPALHFFGHIHEGRGDDMIHRTGCFNCSHVDEKYNPVHSAVRVIYEKPLLDMPRQD